VIYSKACPELAKCTVFFFLKLCNSTGKCKDKIVKILILIFVMALWHHQFYLYFCSTSWDLYTVVLRRYPWTYFGHLWFCSCAIMLLAYIRDPLCVHYLRMSSDSNTLNVDFITSSMSSVLIIWVSYRHWLTCCHSDVCMVMPCLVSNSLAISYHLS
jgi:hypothetical protein